MKRIRLGKGLFANLSQKGNALSLAGQAIPTNICKRGVRNTSPMQNKELFIPRAIKAEDEKAESTTLG
jgi:hypothetical protein